MNVRVDLNYPIKDGTEVVFRSPVDCSQVTGLIVYYLGESGSTESKEFAFADAHGNNVGDIDHLFAENVAVKVILDVTTSMAFVQNADTNAYLEGRFAGIEAMVDKLCPSFTESGAVVTCEPVEGYPLEVAWQTKNLMTTDTVELTSNAMNKTIWTGSLSAPFVLSADLSQLTETGTSAGAGLLELIIDGSSVYAGGIQLTSDKGYVVNSGTLTKVIVINWGKFGGTAKFQMEVGTQKTAFEPYAETANITRCGKNVFGGDALADKMASQGAVKNEADGTVQFIPANVDRTTRLFTKFKPNTQYTFMMYGCNIDSAATVNSANLLIVYTDGEIFYIDFDKTAINENGYLCFISKAGKSIQYFGFCYATGETRLYYDKCGIFEGVVPLEGFEAYQSGTFAQGEQIQALSGVNTLWADSGLLTVSGKADPVARLERLENAILAMGANV